MSLAPGDLDPARESGRGGQRDLEVGDTDRDPPEERAGMRISLRRQLERVPPRRAKGREPEATRGVGGRLRETREPAPAAEESGVRVQVLGEGAHPDPPRYRMARGMAEAVVVLIEERPLEILVLDAESDEPVAGPTFHAVRVQSAADRIRLWVNASGHFGQCVEITVGDPGPPTVGPRPTGDVKMTGRVVGGRERPVGKATVLVNMVDRSGETAETILDVLREATAALRGIAPVSG